MKKKICFITGSRADYGLLKPLMKKINNSKKFQLQTIITGSHLSSKFGNTYKEIIKDKIKINEKVNILFSSNSELSVIKSTSIGMMLFANKLKKLNSDIIVILGDRYEIFAAAFASYIMKKPIIHIAGGESTIGSFDEALRHSITKMSYLHFTIAEQYKKRIIQLGENPKNVFNVGSLSIESIKNESLLNKINIEKKFGFKFCKKNLLITFHPITLDEISSTKHFNQLLMALKHIKDTFIIFTFPNADTEGTILIQMIKKFVKEYPNNSIAFKSLGQTNYFSILQFVDGVIGNSSSGLSEVPFFEIGTVNIGDRQKGRISLESVINCKNNKQSILKAIDKLYTKNFKIKIKMISKRFGKGDSSQKIYNIISKYKFPKNIKKKFFDII